jgi:hypothetical protein
MPRYSEQEGCCPFGDAAWNFENAMSSPIVVQTVGQEFVALAVHRLNRELWPRPLYRVAIKQSALEAAIRREERKRWSGFNGV